MSAPRIRTAGSTRPWRFSTVRDRSAIPGPLTTDNAPLWARVVGTAALVVLLAGAVVLALVAWGWL